MIPWGHTVVELYLGLSVGPREEGLTLLLSPQERILGRSSVFPFDVDTGTVHGSSSLVQGLLRLAHLVLSPLRELANNMTSPVTCLSRAK